MSVSNYRDNVKDLLVELEIYESEEQIVALASQINEIILRQEYTRRREDIIRDFENADRDAYHMIVTLVDQTSEERHDHDKCEGSYYPYFDDYTMSPTLICFTCMKVVDP
jgi:hypothetical protein